MQLALYNVVKIKFQFPFPGINDIKNGGLELATKNNGQASNQTDHLHGTTDNSNRLDHYFSSFCLPHPHHLYLLFVASIPKTGLPPFFNGYIGFPCFPGLAWKLIYLNGCIYKSDTLSTWSQVVYCGAGDTYTLSEVQNIFSFSVKRVFGVVVN